MAHEMIGPGKYDELATLARLGTRARGVVVVVIGGRLGDGLSMQADFETTLALPSLLREVADQIEAQTRKLAS